jgi:hypothetical protein
MWGGEGSAFSGSSGGNEGGGGCDIVSTENVEVRREIKPRGGGTVSTPSLDLLICHRNISFEPMNFFHRSNLNDFNSSLDSSELFATLLAPP